MAASIDAYLDDLSAQAARTRKLVDDQVPELSVYTVRPVTLMIEGLQRLRLAAMNAGVDVKYMRKEPSIGGFFKYIGSDENRELKASSWLTQHNEYVFRTIQPYVTRVAEARKQGWVQVGFGDYDFKRFLSDNLRAVEIWTKALRGLDKSPGWGVWIVEGLRAIGEGIASMLSFVGRTLKDAFVLFAWMVKHWWLVGGVVLGIVYRKEIAAGVQKVLPKKAGS